MTVYLYLSTLSRPF